MNLFLEVEDWRLLEVHCSNPFRNLAIEEAVLQAVGKGEAPNTIRLWGNANAVVLGRFQCPQLEINFIACREHETIIARRLTGGGTVYQDAGNLNYSVYLTRTHRLARDSVVEMFRQTALAVALGLRRLGVDAEFKTPNMLMLRGKKISGMAGAVKWGGILVHGTLLVEANLDVLREVLSQPTALCADLPRSVRSVAAEVANISSLCSEPSMKEVRTVLRIGFEEEFGIRLKESTITDEEAAIAEALTEKKYSRPEWILGGLFT